MNLNNLHSSAVRTLFILLVSFISTKYVLLGTQWENLLAVCLYLQLLLSCLLDNSVLLLHSQSSGGSWSSSQGSGKEDECWQSQIRYKGQWGECWGQDCQGCHYKCSLMDLYLDTLCSNISFASFWISICCYSLGFSASKFHGYEEKLIFSPNPKFCFYL